MLLATNSLVALLACSSPQPATFGDPTSVALDDGQVLSGSLELLDLLVPAGATVLVEGGSSIRVSGDVTIHGSLVVLGDGKSDSPPDLRISCQGFFFVDEFGRICGANGVSHDDAEIDPYHVTGAYTPTDGGRGGSVIVEAAQYDCAGTIRAGDGGNASPGGTGGAGGAVIIKADITVYPGVRNPVARGTVRGGDGGRGSAGYYHFDETDPGELIGFVYGGPGGDGGPAEGWPAPEGLRVAAAAGGAMQGENLPPGSSAVLVCDDGHDGADSAVWIGGNGADGADGHDGVAGSPHGKNGTPGGRGSSGKSSDAGNGGNGASCCNPPTAGGNGGDGGNSGAATGGNGGKGGDGGDGYQNPPGTYLGDGGHGGNAGSGGDATSGNGGNAGKGGDGCQPGASGAAGVPGAATGGTRGAIGVGGQGLVQGSPGNPGDNGQSNNGGHGSYASGGSNCCE